MHRYFFRVVLASFIFELIVRASRGMSSCVVKNAAYFDILFLLDLFITIKRQLHIWRLFESAILGGFNLCWLWSLVTRLFFLIHHEQRAFIPDLFSFILGLCTFRSLTHEINLWIFSFKRHFEELSQWSKRRRESRRLVFVVL